MPFPRRTGGVLVGALAALLPLLSSAPAAAAPPALFDRPGARQGAFVSLDEHNGTDELQAYRDFERKWGRRSDLVRVFAEWDTPALFTDAQKILAREGRTLVVSWNSWARGEGVPWAQVASGAHDALIDKRAAQVKQLGRPILFTFQHEPEHWTTNPATMAGTPADFCSAYRRVVDRFRAAGVGNASYGLIMMAWSSNRGRSEPYYCGDAHVDWLASDGYNWYGCVNPQGPWRSPAGVFDEWYAWATSHGKPLLIAEWGTGEDPATPGRKGEWIDALNTWVKNHPAVKGVMIYSTAKNKNCPRYSDTSPSSQAAFRRFGADPYYSGGAAGSAPSAPREVRATGGDPGAPVNATVRWSAPERVGSGPVTSYRITVQRMGPDGKVVGRTTVTRPGTARVALVALPAVGNYRFFVNAVNGAGTGPGSTFSGVVAGR